MPRVNPLVARPSIEEQIVNNALGDAVTNQVRDAILADMRDGPDYEFNTIGKGLLGGAFNLVGSGVDALVNLFGGDTSLENLGGQLFGKNTDMDAGELAQILLQASGQQQQFDLERDRLNLQKELFSRQSDLEQRVLSMRFEHEKDMQATAIKAQEKEQERAFAAASSQLQQQLENNKEIIGLEGESAKAIAQMQAKATMKIEGKRLKNELILSDAQLDNTLKALTAKISSEEKLQELGFGNAVEMLKLELAGRASEKALELSNQVTLLDKQGEMNLAQIQAQGNIQRGLAAIANNKDLTLAQVQAATTKYVTDVQAIAQSYAVDKQADTAKAGQQTAADTAKQTAVIQAAATKYSADLGALTEKYVTDTRAAAGLEQVQAEIQGRKDMQQAELSVPKQPSAADQAKVVETGEKVRARELSENTAKSEILNGINDYIDATPSSFFNHPKVGLSATLNKTSPGGEYSTEQAQKDNEFISARIESYALENGGDFEAAKDRVIQDITREHSEIFQGLNGFWSDYDNRTSSTAEAARSLVEGGANIRRDQLIQSVSASSPDARLRFEVGQGVRRLLEYSLPDNQLDNKVLGNISRYAAFGTSDLEGRRKLKQKLGQASTTDDYLELLVDARKHMQFLTPTYSAVENLVLPISGRDAAAYPYQKRRAKQEHVQFEMGDLFSRYLDQ